HVPLVSILMTGSRMAADSRTVPSGDFTNWSAESWLIWTVVGASSVSCGETRAEPVASIAPAIPQPDSGANGCRRARHEARSPWSVNLTGQIDVAEGDLIASVSPASERSAPASMPTLPALIWAGVGAARSPGNLAIGRKLGRCQ